MTIEITEGVEVDKGTLQDLLSKTHREELNEILVIGEKYKKEGEEMKSRFWGKYKRKEFLSLAQGYEESEERFIEGLEPDEKIIINGLNVIERKKFFDEYLKDRILYSGNVELECDLNRICYDKEKYSGIEGLKKRVIEQKHNLHLGVKLELEWCNIGVEGVEIIAKERKDNLQPGISIDLAHNNIGDEGLKILAEEWKDNLQPGMSINLDYNQICAEGPEILARERKDKLQPGMAISLFYNDIGAEGVEKLAKERKDCLQPGMSINLSYNNIGAEGVEILASEWNDKLQPGMTINLSNNDIGDEGVNEIMKLDLKEGVEINLSSFNISVEMIEKLERWVNGYRDNGIYCYIII